MTVPPRSDVHKHHVWFPFVRLLVFHISIGKKQEEQTRPNEGVESARRLNTGSQWTKTNYHTFSRIKEHRQERDTHTLFPSLNYARRPMERIWAMCTVAAVVRSGHVIHVYIQRKELPKKQRERKA